ncbi:MAG TPA: hypothetical protein QF700_04425 [Prochlorococcus sp.]|nr:hypothetical protein [Prochlorococcus sp.]
MLAISSEVASGASYGGAAIKLIAATNQKLLIQQKMLTAIQSFKREGNKPTAAKE